jgi:hypothetical protein
MARTRSRRRDEVRGLGLAFAALGVLAVAFWIARPSAERATLGASETPTAMPVCGRVVDTKGMPASPVPVGSPAAGVVCTETGPGTPVATDGLVLTLAAGQDKAGPVDLTVEIVDEAGEPVVDATVLFLTQHLEMSHGVSVDAAFHSGDGRYSANKVSMGMGGHWQVEVQATRPGQPAVVAVFVVALTGPQH